MLCGAFKASLAIHPDGLASPCCIFDKNHFRKLEDLDMTDPWKGLEDGRGCNACKRPGNVYKDAFDRYLPRTQFEIKFLDIRNNNLCNFECIICNSYYSSKWASRLGEENKFVSHLVDINTDLVERIYFAGGEPLLNEDHWKILKQVKNPENVNLLYSTNLSVLGNKRDHVADYWPRFQHVVVYTSLDGIGQFGEIMRYGLDMPTFDANLQIIKELPNVEVRIAATISLLNVWFMDELDAYATAHNLPVDWNVLYGPDFLALSALPMNLRASIPRGKNVQIDQQLELDNSFLFADTISYIRHQDKIKGTALMDMLPFKEYI